VPTFCRHNRLVQNCPICSREQNVAMRPVVTGGERRERERAVEPRERTEHLAKQRAARAPRSATKSGGNGVRVRRLARGADDGFRSGLVPGLRSSEDAERMAQEIAFASRRLQIMELVAAGDQLDGVDPAWAEIAGASGADIEARTELAFRHVINGPRGLRGDDRVEDTIIAFEGWTARSGSRESAFTGEPGWTPERRFERIFERLQFGGMTRDARYELLTLLGRLGVYELRGARLFFGGENEVTWAAKRALGIGDPLLLERRAAQLAEAAAVPLEALDLGLHNWGSGTRIAAGIPDDAEVDPEALAGMRDALDL